MILEEGKKKKRRTKKPAKAEQEKAEQEKGRGNLSAERERSDDYKDETEGNHTSKPVDVDLDEGV